MDRKRCASEKAATLQPAPRKKGHGPPPRTGEDLSGATICHFIIAEFLGIALVACTEAQFKLCQSVYAEMPAAIAAIRADNAVIVAKVA